MRRTAAATPPIPLLPELRLRAHRRSGRSSCRHSAAAGLLRTLAATVLLAVAVHATAAAAAPDLVIASLDLNPTSGPNGTQVAITATILNQGDATAAASVTRIRINQDASSVGPGDDPLCNTLPTGSLDPGASVEVSCTATLSQRPSGANYIWAIADVNKSIGQTAVDNDRSAALFTVNNQAADLIVQDIVVTPASLSNGMPVTITATIANQGIATALASTTRIRINQNASSVTSTDIELCNLPTPSVAGGASVQVQCTPTISGRPPGTNYVWIIADVNKAAGQDDTTNDRSATPLEVSGEASDLVIDTVTVLPTGGPNGKPVLITALIRNQGAATALASAARVRINLDANTVGAADTPICGPLTTPSIDPGETAQIRCNPTLTDRPSGTNYIWVIADTGDTAGQSDRTNDRANAAFLVDPPAIADLVVSSVSVSPTSTQNGKSISVTATIVNNGFGNALSSKTRFVINQNADAVVDGDTVLCDQVDTPATSPGTSVQVKCKTTLTGAPVGTNYVWAVADVTGVSGQTNLDNDKRAAALTVTPSPAPDLVVESLQASPTSARSGNSVAITATIRNQGNAPAAASTARVRVNNNPGGFLDSDPVACSSVPTASISAGSAVTIHCNWIVGDQAPGQAYLWATADVADTAGQNSRGNDSRNALFTVLAPDGPDLTITRLTVLPTTARNGQAVVVKARVTNVGNQSAAASVTTVRINEDPSNVYDGDIALCSGLATPALAPQATVSVRCVATINNRPIGANRVWAIVDTTTTSGQVNASNDRRSALLTVAPADCTDPLSPPTLAWPIEQPHVLQDYASYGSVPLPAGKLGYHSGMDLVSLLPIAPEQTPVYAAADGEVVTLHRGCPSPADAVVNPPAGRCSSGWGNYVVIRHGAGVYSVYAHLGKIVARRGCVEQGQRIAIVGSSGATTNPVLLHLDVLADLVEPVSRKALGAEYYKKYHPFVGHQPETDAGSLQIHLDPRDFMIRSRVRITQATVASRGTVSGGVPTYLDADQQYVSYGELVPGFFCIDLPDATLPQDGPPYADDVRYGWVAAADVEVVESDLAPHSLRIDGYEVFNSEGTGAGAVVMHQQATATSAEISKAWGGQQFAPSGGVVTEQGNGRLWQPVDVPGSAATGPGKPRKAWVPLDRTGPSPR